MPRDPLHIGAIVWWNYADGKRVLGRIVMVSTPTVSVKVLSATPEQVLEMKYGAGEFTHVLRSVLEPAETERAPR